MVKFFMAWSLNRPEFFCFHILPNDIKFGELHFSITVTRFVGSLQCLPG